MYNAGIHGVARGPRASLSKKVSTFVHANATPANLIGLGGGFIAIFCLLALPASQNWNIRLPLYLVLVIWTLLRPRVALYLLPVAIPWGSLDPITLAGFNLNSADILVLLLATSWLMSFTLRPFVTGRQSGPLDRKAFNTPRYLVFALLALLLAMLFSMATTLSISLSLKEIVKWLEALIVLVLGTQYLHTRRQLWTLVIIVCLAAISQAILGYAQYAFNLGPASFIRDAGLRVYGTFDQPNPYAGYINMSLTIAVALLLLGRGVATRVLAGLAVVVLAGVEFLSQSKGGYIALAVALLFIFTIALFRRRVLFSGIIIAVLCIISIYLAGLLPERAFLPLLQKVGLLNLSFTFPTAENYANSERLAHWVAGLLMFRDHPLFGVGIGNYASAYPRYAQGIFVIPLGHAHNYYINIAAEAGIVGLAGLVSFLLAAFVAGSRSLRSITKKCEQLVAQRAKPRAGIQVAEARATQERLQELINDRALAVGLIAALLSVCIHNLVDNLYVHSMTSLFVLLLVMLIRLDVGAPDKCNNSNTL
jgi:O-antigen ligase